MVSGLTVVTEHEGPRQYLEARMDALPPISELGVIVGRTKGFLLTEQTAQRAVVDLAQAAHKSIEHAGGAGVSLIMGGERTSVGYTDSYVLAADTLQYELREGPCLTAWATAEAQLIDDTTVDGRWKLWNAAAAEAGVRSCATSPLMRGRESIGAMKVYSRSPHAFTSGDVGVLNHLATSAAALLGHIQTSNTPQRISREMTDALESRTTTDVARGIIMERHGLDPDGALEYLLELAKTSRTTMADVANRIVAHQDLEAPQGEVNQ